jgi:hypothetical protein
MRHQHDYDGPPLRVWWRDDGRRKVRRVGCLVEAKELLAKLGADKPGKGGLEECRDPLTVFGLLIAGRWHEWRDDDAADIHDWDLEDLLAAEAEAAEWAEAEEVD